MGERTWNFDLTLSNTEKNSLKDIADPPGFMKSNLELEEMKGKAKDFAKEKELKMKRAQEMAMAPLKNIAMQGFMMWMSGSQINIFSIMITGMAFMNPIKAILGVNQMFAKLDDRGTLDLTIPKLTFIAVNILGIGSGLYKCATMGLLPLTSADW
eukprot:CAMPEP_0117758186 /NCGR_PEP_ID=MMETSP0947-20121206/15217_1 /TAXON_ID=44440 /ORGANISM="Chattonella subsalsa, Strain CCMP2191" /LENGTH=154 /DNA_ID=CAMNT_0005578303 /DNA_START=50 /DNA_END=511 /DNA_ORIENTATION=-